MHSTTITPAFSSCHRSRAKRCSYWTLAGREHWPKGSGDPQSVARKLDATILFYSLGPDKSWLWAVTANRTRLFVLPKQRQIDAGVQAYQKAILRSSDPLREANEDARALY